MSATISITFYARQSRAKEDGQTPIFMRVKIGADYFDTNTRIFIAPNRWSGATGKVKGNQEHAKFTNSLLDTFRSKALDIQRQLMLEGKQITIAAIKNRWFGVSVERSRMLMEIFEHHNSQMKELIGKEFSSLTYQRYVTSKKHTQEFLKWKLKVEDISISELNYEFITDYEFWLKSVRNCDHNTTLKYLSNFKKIVNICLKNSWLQRNPFIGYKMTKREVERPYLTFEELNRIATKTFIAPRINQVRDIFLFSCYTGLAYADVKKLSRSEISVGIDGDKWIFTHRQKTESATRIPLLPPAQEILERYASHPQCLNEGRLLPVLSNQKMNGYLKEIADMCDITKKMTTHTARHTFATTVTLTNGVPIETVSKMLGHKNLKTTQHYAKILDMKVSQDMGALKAIFKAQSKARIPTPAGAS
ncbi:MAG: integrase family protein [Bacteroidetes bacterium OLB12]|nr:MAG: integrase family protein [Bacteroidetes bacterium OLB12]